MKEETPVTAPLDYAEYMPEFPGGKGAFLKFMHKHLRQPDDLEEGAKVVVRLKFLVDTDGTIKDFTVMQSGGILDGEVLRVVNKMPRWKPSKQNESSVLVGLPCRLRF